MARFHQAIAIALLSLPVAGAADAQTSAAVNGSEDGKVVCRRVYETGSLVKATKVCKTKKEWKMGRDSARNEARDLTQTMNAQSSN